MILAAAAAETAETATTAATSSGAMEGNFASHLGDSEIGDKTIDNKDSGSPQRTLDTPSFEKTDEKKGLDKTEINPKEPYSEEYAEFAKKIPDNWKDIGKESEHTNTQLQLPEIPEHSSEVDFQKSPSLDENIESEIGDKKKDTENSSLDHLQDGQTNANVEKDTDSSVNEGVDEAREENSDNKSDTSETQEPYKDIPKSDGTWEGEPGDSKFKPDPEVHPKKYNPEDKSWGQILDENQIDGVDFNEGEPDFSEIAEETVEIDEYSTDRDDNYDAADAKLAEKWTEEQKDGHSWTPEDIEDYRKEHQLSWHEKNDMKTMQLVPREVHLNIKHKGGISIAKSSTNTTEGNA